MATAVLDEQNLIDIANAIRQKNGTNNVYKPNEMANAINEITTKEDLDDELTTQETLLENQINKLNVAVDTLKNKAIGGETPEYIRVNYIQFTGQQSIDTGVICNQDTKIKAIFTREKSAQHYIFGVASSDNKAAVTAYCGGNWRFGNKATSKNPITNEEMVYSGILDKSQITITSSKTAISSVNEFETIGTLLIGTCRSSDGTIASPQFIGKIYSFEIWQGEEQVLKLIPAIKDDVYGFWNEINKEFFTSITDTSLEGGM